MIRLKAEVFGKHLEIALQLRDKVVSADIDGRHHDLEVRALGDGDYLLVDGNSVYDCRVVTSRNEADRIEVNLRGISYALRLTDPKRLRSGQSGAEHQKGAAEIVAPMPGKVVRVLVEIGAQVEAGAGILVVEAMKMQNEMKSPKAGVVSTLHTETGATVNAGDVLAVVE